MRTVFFGTPEWAVPSLEALIDSEYEIAAVVTNPDRPAGRKLEPRPSPVKTAAIEAGIEVMQPEKARDPEFIAEIERLAPDFATVVAYGKILPAALLDIPRLGFVNVHFSILPSYRGAAPVQRAVMNGDAETGVSIMLLTEGMDEGPVLAVERTSIATDESAGEVGARLASMGSQLLIETLPAYTQGDLESVEQDGSAATYAPKIDPDESRIDWSLPAEKIRDVVRGLDPEPGAWTELADRRIKIFRAEPVSRTRLRPGELAWSGGALMVGTGTDPVELLEVQPAGKRRMSGAEMARGSRPAPGERFG